MKADEHLPDEYEVSPLFKFGRFVCDTCQGRLGLTHENVDRLINNGPLKCIRCGTSLEIEEQTRADLKAVFNRMVVRHRVMVFLGSCLAPICVGLKFMYGASFLVCVILASAFFIYLFTKTDEKNEPEVYVSLKKRRPPEQKRRYRRLWRLDYK